MNKMAQKTFNKLLEAAAIMNNKIKTVNAKSKDDKSLTLRW